MRFEWDEAKSRLNRKKRGISFELATEVFTIEDRMSGDEQRFWMIGRLEDLVLIVVVHTTKDERGGEITRIISARKATRRERKYYEKTDI